MINPKYIIAKHKNTFLLSCFILLLVLIISLCVLINHKKDGNTKKNIHTKNEESASFSVKHPQDMTLQSHRKERDNNKNIHTQDKESTSAGLENLENRLFKKYKGKTALEEESESEDELTWDSSADIKSNLHPETDYSDSMDDILDIDEIFESNPSR